MRKEQAISNIDKIIAKMRNQPHGIRLEEVDKVLQAYGFREDRQRGSHKQYVHNSGYTITIVQKNPIKAYQVVDILKIIRKI